MWTKVKQKRLLEIVKSCPLYDDMAVQLDLIRAYESSHIADDNVLELLLYLLERLGKTITVSGGYESMTFKFPFLLRYIRFEKDFIEIQCGDVIDTISKDIANGLINVEIPIREFAVRIETILDVSFCNGTISYLNSDEIMEIG